MACVICLGVKYKGTHAQGPSNHCAHRRSWALKQGVSMTIVPAGQRFLQCLAVSDRL